MGGECIGDILLFLKIMPALTVQAPAKSILFGEHAVVYGFPGIAVPINSSNIKITIFPKPVSQPGEIDIYHTETSTRYTLASLNPTHPIKKAIDIIKNSLTIDHLPSSEIHITSTIPNSAGLGSSAAFAVAFTRAISNYMGFGLSDEKINQISFEIEKIQHGSPSGIDNTVITYQKPIYFRKDEEVEFLPIKKDLKIVIADSGKRTPTKEVVAYVKERYQRDSQRINQIFERIETVVESAKHHFINTDVEALGALMNENHVALEELGVSCDILEHLRHAALKVGAFGAKMCGGGRGGIIAALAPENRLDSVVKSLRLAGSTLCFISLITPFESEVIK